MRLPSSKQKISFCLAIISCPTLTTITMNKMACIAMVALLIIGIIDPVESVFIHSLSKLSPFIDQPLSYLTTITIWSNASFVTTIHIPPLFWQCPDRRTFVFSIHYSFEHHHTWSHLSFSWLSFLQRMFLYSFTPLSKSTETLVNFISSYTMHTLQYNQRHSPSIHFIYLKSTTVELINFSCDCAWMSHNDTFPQLTLNNSTQTYFKSFISNIIFHKWHISIDFLRVNLNSCI